MGLIALFNYIIWWLFCLLLFVALPICLVWGFFSALVKFVDSFRNAEPMKPVDEQPVRHFGCDNKK